MSFELTALISLLIMVPLWARIGWREYQKKAYVWFAADALLVLVGVAGIISTLSNL
jgi:hypothetical protein